MYSQQTFRFFQRFSIRIFSTCIFWAVTTALLAQSDTIKYHLTLTGVSSTGEYSPFWLQSNQYGKVSASPSSGFFSAGISKEYVNGRKLLDYGFKADALVLTDKTNTSVYFHELYAKARFWVFDMFAGSKEQIIGNQDSILSSGGLIFSKNARPIPQVHVGIDQFRTIPFTFGLLAIKGGLSHGWFTDNIYTEGMLFHHKFFYMQVGANLPVRIQYGVDHAAEWGGKTPLYGGQPITFKDFKAVFYGNSGGTGGEAINALGNHIISQSLRMDIHIADYRIAGYWQTISEDSPIRFIGNSPNKADGLWGISVRNKKSPYIKGIVYEYLNTTDQNGPYHDKDGVVYGGADSYFQNYVYNNGWSHYSRIIGTPFISSAVYNKNGSVSTANNRVMVQHFGMEGNISGYSYKALASFSKNYGTYGSPINTKNTSAMLEVSKNFPKLSNIQVSCSAGADIGKLYGNSFGMLVSIRKSGNVFRY